MENHLLKELLSAEDSIKIKVRFNDMDAMGIVHFKNYLVYFDDGFVSFMNNIENPVAVESAVKRGIVFPVKKINIEYEESARFGDHIIVKTKLKEIGDKSMTFIHNLFRETDNLLLAKVECVRLVMELSTKKLLNVKEFFADFV
jgi:acyl-CoA thioester hydrolase